MSSHVDMSHQMEVTRMEWLLILLTQGGSTPHPMEDDPFTRVILEASAYVEGVDSDEQGALFYEVGPTKTTLGAQGADGTCTGIIWEDGSITPLMDIRCPSS